MGSYVFLGRKGDERDCWGCTHRHPGAIPGSMLRNDPGQSSEGHMECRGAKPRSHMKAGALPPVLPL